MKQRPNILFLMADQMRADALGILNGWVRTPNLDRLAREGILFSGIISNSAECIPARFSLATGLYPHQTGVWQNGLFTLNPECPNWMQAIERAGYATSLFGKTHLHPHEGDLRDRLDLMHAYGLQVVDETTGPHASVNTTSNMTDAWQESGLLESFREDMLDRIRTKRHLVRPSVLGVEHHYDTYVGRQAATYLKNLDSPSPWFCWVSFAGPHEPWDAPQEYVDLYDRSAIPLPIPRPVEVLPSRGLLKMVFDSDYYSPAMLPDEVRAMRASYAGNVTLIDEHIGSILDVIRERGELDETLIVFTSDHGEMNGDHGLLYKANFLDPAIRVPLIIKLPRDFPASENGRLNSIVELMDVGATICDYAGTDQAETSNARSLRPLIEGIVADHRAFAVSEFLEHTALVDKHWKIEFAPKNEPCVLFDLTNDPLEQVNIADDLQYRDTIGRLKERVIAFQARTPQPAVKVTI